MCLTDKMFLQTHVTFCEYLLCVKDHLKRKVLNTKSEQRKKRKKERKKERKEKKRKKERKKEKKKERKTGVAC